MFLYIILALLIINIGLYFHLPKYKAKLIKQANPLLLERIKSESDGSMKANIEIRKTLTEEGHDLKEIEKALAGAAYYRLGNNISLGPVYAIIACLFFLTRIVVSRYGYEDVFVGLVISTVFLFITMYAYKHYDQKHFLKNND